MTPRIEFLTIKNMFIGARRVIDVFDCDTHDGEQMTMHAWISYYLSEKHDTIKNVTSLEISHTGLDRIISCPEVVKYLIELIYVQK